MHQVLHKKHKLLCVKAWKKKEFFLFEFLFLLSFFRSNIRIYSFVIEYKKSWTLEQCVWALGNVSGDISKCRDYVLGLNALPPLLKICVDAISSQNKHINLSRTAAWVLSNFCHHKPFQILDGRMKRFVSIFTKKTLF